MAKALPETTIVVDHCGGVLRINSYKGCRDEVFARWRTSMRELAELPNVHVKLGGLGMRISGFGFARLATAPSSELLAKTWKPSIETCIEAFARRCAGPMPVRRRETIASDCFRAASPGRWGARLGSRS